MSISPGFTAADIREVVHSYQLVPFGQKSEWLVGQGVSPKRLRRWQSAVFEGDLDRGLIPREGSEMTIPPDKRTVMAKLRDADREAHEAEVARLNARVRELEGTNTALGKAIGLLHAMSEEEPARTPTTPDPPTS